MVRIQRTVMKCSRKPRGWGAEETKPASLQVSFYALTLCVLMSSPTVI